MPAPTRSSGGRPAEYPRSTTAPSAARPTQLTYSDVQPTVLKPRPLSSGTRPSRSRLATFGIARLHVVRDNPFALRAGRALYAEPKLPGWFEVGLPSFNGPVGETWTMQCKAATIGPDDTLEKDPSPLLDVTANLDGATAVAAGSARSPTTARTSEGRLLAGPMNVYRPYRWYDLVSPEYSARTRLTVHAPDDCLGTEARPGSAQGVTRQIT